MSVAETQKAGLGHPISQRSAALLEAARSRVQESIYGQKETNWTHAFFELYAEEPLRWRQALSFAHALTCEPVILLPDERVVGMLYQAVPGSGSCDLGGAACDPRWADYDARVVADQRIMAELPELVTIEGSRETWLSPVSCAPGHIGWNWNWVVDRGIADLLKRIDTASATADEAGRETLEGMRICLQAVLDWCDQHVEALEARAGTAEGEDRDRLLENAILCRRVPRHGARTFREAIQGYHFSYLATIYENPHGGNGPGRLDYFLWPYLKRDLAEGTETLESARELIDELFIRFHERLVFQADGWVEALAVGGCDAHGVSAANPLTRITVESIAGLGISHPSVYIRVPEDAPGWMMDLAACDVVEGGQRAQILSDRAVIAAMMRGGMPAKDARMYMCGGCMEISPQGMNSDMLFTGFFNLPKLLGYVLTGGVCQRTGERRFPHLDRTLADFTDFEDLYQAIEEELSRVLTLTFRRMDITSEEFARLRPRFLISSQIADCIERGRVIHDGGARYEDYGATPLAIPNVGDSLFALKRAVFDEGFVSGAELLDAMKADFEGCEVLRRRLAHVPRFGQGHADADAMVDRVARTVGAIFNGYKNRHGGRVKAMIMTFVLAPEVAASLGATPDGHKAGSTIAQGMTPQGSAMTDGITTAMQAANSVDLTCFTGGATTMWDLTPQFATVNTVKSLLSVFIQGGGQIYQGNTTDVEVLKDALIHPEQHEALMVRVGGYSGRFVALSSELQHEIISRYRHEG